MANQSTSVYEGKVAIVTGGASGIGKACAERFSKLGVTVIIADLPLSDGVKVAANIPNKMTQFFAVDITNEKEVEKVIEQVRSEHGRLDILVNSAGIQRFPHPVYNFEVDEPHNMEVFNKVIQVNLVGTFNVIRLAVGLMAKNTALSPDGERGIIINIGSAAPLDGVPEMTAYVASKAALNGMTLSLAREFGRKGIRVVTVAPGVVDTPMLGNLPPAEKDLFVKTVASASAFPKRFSSPDEIAHLVQSIIDNPMINGEVIRIDGGFRHAFAS